MCSVVEMTTFIHYTASFTSNILDSTKARGYAAAVAQPHAQSVKDRL